MIGIMGVQGVIQEGSDRSLDVQVGVWGYSGTFRSLEFMEI